MGGAHHAGRRSWGRTASLLALLAACLGAFSTAPAQTLTRVSVPGRGAGSFSVSLDYFRAEEVEVGDLSPLLGDMDLTGREFYIHTRAAFFEFDYGLTDKLALTASLPLKSSRAYSSDFPHDPGLLVDDHGEEFIDDGDYHTFWADLGVSLRWLARATDRYALSPFVSYYTPSNDYPIYALAQPGRGQWRVDVGLNSEGRLGPPRANLYWRAGYAYSYTEKVEPADAPAQRVNRSRLTLELGWLATPRLSPYVVYTDTWSHGGLGVLEFTGIFVSDQWYYHDQLFPWEQSGWTVGTGYALSDRFGLSFGYGRSLDVDFGFFHEPALSAGFTYAWR